GPPEGTIQRLSRPIEERRPRLVVLLVVDSARPSGGGVLEEPLERRPVELRGYVGALEAAGDHGDVVALVPPLVDLRYDGPCAARDRGGRRVALTLHHAVQQRRRREPLSRQGTTEPAALLDPRLAEHVVVLGTERRLSVPDQQHEAHQRPTPVETTRR